MVVFARVWLTLIGVRWIGTGRPMNGIVRLIAIRRVRVVYGTWRLVRGPLCL